MELTKVSAVIITYNESANINRTLSQLWWCDEIIILDSFSTDDTLDICKKHRCKIYQRRFDGYGSQKQYAVSLAKNDMVLCVDADEVLSDELVSEIRAELAAPSADGYLMKMNFVFFGKVFRHGKESKKYYLRLFNKKYGGFNAKKVHEGVEFNGSTKKLKEKIYHYSYKNIAHYFEKFNRYSSLGADLAFENSKKKSLGLILIALPFYFFRYYFIEGNFKNRLEGFYWSVFNAFYHFVKYIKIKEAYQLEKQRFDQPTGDAPFKKDNAATIPMARKNETLNLIKHL